MDGMTSMKSPSRLLQPPSITLFIVLGVALLGWAPVLPALEKDSLARSAVCFGMPGPSTDDQGSVLGTGFLLERDNLLYLVTAYHVVHQRNNLHLFSTEEKSPADAKRISLASVCSGRMMLASPASDSCGFVITREGASLLAAPPFSRIVIPSQEVAAQLAPASVIVAIGNPTLELLPGSPRNW